MEAANKDANITEAIHVAKGDLHIRTFEISHETFSSWCRHIDVANESRRGP